MGESMTPIQITRALEDAGSSQAAIARECGVSRTTVHLVIHKKGTSKNVRSKICAALNLSEEEIWGPKEFPDNSAPEAADGTQNHC